MLKLRAQLWQILSRTNFWELIEQVRAGDEIAATLLVNAFESEIRREVRLRLTDAKLRRVLDSMDICQSVFRSFFAKTALGQINFDHPDQLFRLLTIMARNKVIDQHRAEKSRRPLNGHKLENVDGNFENEPRDSQPSPSEIIHGNELLEKIDQCLSDHEKEIARLRRTGLTWKEIAERTGKTEESVRKRLARASERVLGQLGID